MIVGLTKADSGSILYEGKDISKMSEREFRPPPEKNSRWYFRILFQL